MTTSPETYKRGGQGRERAIATSAEEEKGKEGERTGRATDAPSMDAVASSLDGESESMSIAEDLQAAEECSISKEKGKKRPRPKLTEEVSDSSY
jgi:hypothetical protein